MGLVSYGSNASDAFGIVVEKCPDYQIASRKVEKISVEGRNGDLLRDTGAYNNVTQVYSVYYNAKGTSFQAEAHNISAWLGAYGDRGYQRLEDEYDPLIYREAIFTGMTNFRNWMNDFGRIDLTFDCKPQRWVKDGQDIHDLEEGWIINEFMACYPILVITGNGTLKYGKANITITNNEGITTFLDTETGDAYAGSIGNNFNQPIDFTKSAWGNLPVSASWQVPVERPSLLDRHLYFSWWASYGSPNTGLLAIDMVGNDSYTLYGTGWTVSHNALDDFLTISCNSDDVVPIPRVGVSMRITGSISALLNRNSNVSIDGNLEAVPNGGMTLSPPSGMTVQFIPRWWTL